MNNDELIADRIEEVIEGMLKHFSSLEPRVAEYSMFYNPRKHPSWIILIFFSDKYELRKGLKNGLCYQIHSYLGNELRKISQISNINRNISFESGSRPVETNDIDNLFNLLVDKQNALERIANKENVKVCANCGHDFDKHQLLFNLNEDNATPTEGWIMCPEEDCNCFQTWGANYKVTTE